MDTARLATENVKRLFFVLSGPAILAQIVTVVYNMMNRIYIGQLPDSRAMMAAIGITAPLSLLVTAFTALFANGGAPLCAIRLGEGKRDEAEHIMSNSFAALMGIGVAIMAVCLIGGEPLLYLFGARGETLTYGLSYLRVYILGTLFVQMSVGMNVFINTQGFAKVAMRATVVGMVLNALLDPLFIYGFRLNVVGAAIATVISQGVSAALVMHFIVLGGSELRLRREFMAIRWQIIKPVMALGVSPFVMKLTESLVSIVFNNQLVAYGGDLAVSVMTIMTSIWQMAQLMTHGFTDGAQPIISYNYGAGAYDRVRATLRLDVFACWGWAFLCAVAVLGFPGLFLRLFTSDAEVLAAGPAMLRTYFFGMLCYGAFNACQQAYIALGDARSSLFFALLRKVFLLIPLVYLCPVVLPVDQVLAVLAAEPIADIISTVASCICFFRFYRRALSAPAEAVG